MGAQYQGKVTKTYPSRYGGSFGLEGQQGLYFNTKAALPAFVVSGATVAFEAEMGRNGKSVYVADATLKESAPPPQAAQGARGVTHQSTDESIRYQSSRKDALVAVGLLLANGALWNPEKSPVPSKRAGIIEAAVDRFTAIYFEDIEHLGALSRTAPVEAPKAAAVAAAASDEELPE